MLRVIKDKDGNERIVTEDEYHREKSLNAFGGVIEAVAISAHQSGGLLFAANCLLFILLVLLYMLGCVAYNIHPEGTSVLAMIGKGVVGLGVLGTLVAQTRWIALLVQLAVLFGLLSQMIRIG
ncbi:hypothetical protein [Comamonas terrae]|uniref:Uncharacterized protein n=1 Tax=Comamonas terrae TaxID=673548 RepID=A0ABW5UGX6_9BURK|nr:hypothetical protein [Comamonas terrae]